MLGEQTSTRLARALMLVISCIPLASCLHEDLKIPDPFGGSENKQGYFAIDSYQVSSSHHQSARIDVAEYFSLKTGVSYSIQANKDDRSADPLLIVVDGFSDKSYIVRNYNANRVHSDRIECELDQQHNHRQIFPWQYKFEAKRRTPGYLFGVGAIWLNAIREQQNSCSLHFDQISHPTKNAWKMWARNVEVELLFDKTPTGAPSEDYSRTRLDSIHVTKRHSIDTDDKQNTFAVGLEKKDIFVSDVRYIANVVDDATLLQVTSVIGRCRRQAKNHRAFPDLLAAVSSSPDGMFLISYMQTKYAAAKDLASGSYDARRHRHVFDREFRSEWFSFQKETSSISYVAMDESVAPGSGGPNEQADTFVKRYTDTVMGQTPRRPSSVTYHLVERANELFACYSYHEEPNPTESYMMRPVHFYTRRRTKVSGLLTGLGALIMNAADSHHMQFGLYGKSLDAVTDPADTKETSRIKVDEWQMYDKATGRTIKFFFRQPQDDGGKQRVQDLVRIDICKDVDSADRRSFALLYRYDIFDIDTEVSPTELELAFELPPECFLSKPDHLDSDSDSEGPNDSSYYDDSEFPTDQPGEETQTKDEEDEDSFEFNPGNLVEHMEFPRLFNFLDGRAAYEIESLIEFGSDKFRLKERVDLQSSQTILSLSGELGAGRKALEFHINYNSELVFEVSDEQCKLLEDINQPEWLGLISSELSYFKSVSPANSSSGLSREIVESSKLRSFGVGALWRQASESEFTRYDGFTNIEATGEAKWREMTWTLEQEEHSNSEVVFVFRYDSEQHKRNQELKVANRWLDLIRLSRIELHSLGPSAPPGAGLKIQVKSVEYPDGANLEPDAWKLPAFCSGALSEASRKARTEYHNEDVTIPSLTSFIRQPRAYTVRYTISHTQLGGAQYAGSTAGLPIEETFDLAARKGRLTVGAGLDRRFVFVDGSESRLFTYLERTDDCKRLGVLNSLVDLGEEPDNSSPGQERLYGLGALWNRLARAQNGLLKVHFRVDSRGFKREIRTYRLATSHNEANTRITQFLIHMVFAELDSGPSDGGQLTLADHFKLESIDIFPKRIRGKDSKWNHRTTIAVGSFAPSTQQDWSLPEACERRARQAGMIFPKLSDTISYKRQFYMRSELSSTRVVDSGDKRMLTLVEEWIHEKNYRFRTLNLEPNFEILIYGSTRESFDLRFPFQCSWKLWKATERRQMDQEEQNNVLDFWSTDVTSPSRPSLVNFAPAALWLAAERETSNLRLVSSADLAPLPEKGAHDATENGSQRKEREMRLVTWQVTSSAPSRPAWSYRLTFEQVEETQADGKTREWHILDSIELEELDSDGNKLTVELQVVNYKYELSQDEIGERFSLPEAHGCRRAESVLRATLNTSDELQLRPNYQHKIMYRASLELTGLHKDGLKMHVSPISGALYSSGRNLGERIQVLSHHVRSRAANGLTKTTKDVFDKFSATLYSLDWQTGLCEIGRQEAYDWRLSFSLADQSGSSDLSSLQIKLDDNLFELLFLNTVQLGFRPINRWTSDGWHLATYELELDSLKLFEHLSEGQPATIVRRFFSYGQEPRLVGAGDRRLFYRRTSIETKVHLFNKERDKILGRFAMTLNAVEGSSLAEIMQANTVEECYNNGLEGRGKRIGSFVFVLKLDEPRLFDWLRYNSLFSEREFLLKLMRKASLSPTQFVDTPRIQVEERESSLRISFRLLDAPTATEFFKRRAHSNLADDLLARSEFKLLPDLKHCSNWCDRESCLALSFCSGRVCRILTDSILREAGLSQVRERIMSSVPDEACEYFYASGFRPSSLAQFSQLVRSDLARVPASSVFGLDLDDQYVMPSEFYEQPSSDRAEQPTLVDDGMPYTRLARSDIELDMDKIMKTPTTVVFDQTDSFDECLEKCVDLSCPVVSYDADRTSCTILKSHDELKNLLLTKRTERTRVSIAVRDRRDEYRRFADTAMPKVHKRKLEDYSAVECASACSVRDSEIGGRQKCLSFDHCRSVGSQKSLCFLQEVHVLLDSFDRSLLEPKLESARQDFTCEHYSRSVLADFEELANRRLRVSSGARERSVGRESCALECHQANDCWAFEYCTDQLSGPSSRLCRMVLGGDQPSALAGIVQDPVGHNSSSCSVFVLRHATEQYDWQSAASGAFVEQMYRFAEKHASSPRIFVTLLFYMIVAICVGLAIQVALIRLTGRSVVFEH